MSAHTPGPWYWNGNNIDAKDCGHVDGICKMLFTSEPDANEQVEADGDLISAAPDLLAILEVIVNETMEYPPVQPYSHDSYLPPHMIEQAQAAIKKARGEA